ncbi:MAG: thiol-disulfide oxidoreductase DCC family protein, partial [Flavobacteriaceae bacterium]
MKQAVLVYDSTCLLCSRSVQFILKYDINIHFLFSTFQSEFSKKHSLSPDSVVVVTPDEKLLQRHHAVRYIITHLPKLRWLRFLFVLTPSFLQKEIYTLVAKNRKRWFGSHSC